MNTPENPASADDAEARRQSNREKAMAAVDYQMSQPYIREVIMDVLRAADERFPRKTRETRE